MAPTATILTLGEWLAVFNIMVVGSAPQAEEGVVAGMVGPRIVEEIAGVVDLIVGQVFEGRHTVNDAGGDAVIGVCISQGLGALEALL